MLTGRLARLVVLGAGAAALVAGCDSDFDDCTATRTCSGASAGSGDAGSPAAGSGGTAGSAGSGTPAGAGTQGGSGPSAGAGPLGSAGEDDTSAGAPGTTDACTAEACPDGCCTADGECVKQTATRCGRNGASCATCEDGQRCDTTAGMCSCDAVSCPDGCCSEDSQCLGQLDAHCGLGGAACDSCSADERCDKAAGTCVCDAETCPNGCCDGDGRCVSYAEQKTAQCGEAGAACGSCAQGQTCTDHGLCACTAESCDGWCHHADCQPFETIASGQASFPSARGIAVSSGDAYWTSSSSSDPRATKYRVQRRLAGGNVETLLSNEAPSFGTLLVGAERVFVLNTQTEDLTSIQLDGADWRLDAASVRAFRYREGRVYWPEFVASRFGEVHLVAQSASDPADLTDTPVMTVLAPDYIADIAFFGSEIAFALNDSSSADSSNYSIFVGTNARRAFPSVPGHIERLECDGSGNYYWLQRTSDTSGADLVVQNDGATEPTLITSGLDVTDFALVEPTPGMGTTFVYYAYVDRADQSTGLRLYDVAAGNTYDVVQGNGFGSLTADAERLYFFEAKGHRLVRTALPHVVLGLGQ